jgi:endonuclease YncB( thermonuclease family)
MNTVETYLKSIEFDVKTVKEYIPEINYGKVVKVYDGDTITIVTLLFNGDVSSKSKLYKFNVRILGIDTPELKTKNVGEKGLAIIARNALSELVLNKVVKLENVSYDKYGRILCNVFLDNVNISEWLVSNNHAVLYNGGTKLKKWA